MRELEKFLSATAHVAEWFRPWRVAFLEDIAGIPSLAEVSCHQSGFAIKRRVSIL